MKKVVQTEIPEESYKELSEITEKEGITIKEAVREAIAEYIASKSRFSAEDALFKLKPVKYKDARASEDVDKILYGD